MTNGITSDTLDPINDWLHRQGIDLPSQFGHAMRQAVHESRGRARAAGVNRLAMSLMAGALMLVCVFGVSPVH